MCFTLKPGLEMENCQSSVLVKVSMSRMANLQKCSIFLIVLCTFLISDILGSPIHGKSGGGHGSGGHGGGGHGHRGHGKHHKRSALEEPQDLPTSMSTENSQIKIYAEKGIEKLEETSTGPNEPILEEILEATFFPPAGKLFYEIKVKVGSKQNKDSSQECKVNVWRESDAEPSVTAECGQTRRRRAADDIPEIADLPSKMSVDDPQVKLYAEKGIEKLAETSTGPNEPILEEILEATFFPPAGKLLYEIKMKVGSTKSKDSSQQCKALIWREGGAEPSVTVECGQSGRKKRETEEDPPVDDSNDDIVDDNDDIIDKDRDTVDGIDDIVDENDDIVDDDDEIVELSVDDPEVVKYAQQGLEEYAKKSPGSNVSVVQIIQTAVLPVTVLFHVIEVKYGTSTCLKGQKEDCQNDELETEVCIVFIPINGDKEDMFIRCRNDKKKISIEDSIGPLVMDKPLKISIDDPEVKKYAEKGVEIYAESSTGPNEPILEKIEEASLYPPVGTMLFEIKIKIGTSTCVKGQKENCELKADGESKPCTVNVFIENDKPRVELKCN